MTTSPADPREGAGTGGRALKLLAVTACPTGIAHTYMAAEKLSQAAESLGHAMKVETQGSIGAENVLSDNDVRNADGIIIAADKDVDPARFVGKRLLVVGVAEGIRHPEELIERVRSAPVYGADGDGGATGYEGGDGYAGGAAGSGGGGSVASGSDGDGAGRAGSGGAGSGRGGSGRGGSGGAVGSGGAARRGKERSLAYKALMNGVSYMIPFVVVGGLLLALSLAVGGHPTAKGLVIPEGTFWAHVNDIGTIGFQLMVPILSGYIAYAIGDRPALVPGMIGGWIANTGELYGSEAGAGFIGAIVTGFLAGYLVMWIKKVRVPRFVRPIMPIIVIPIVATAVLGLFFIYVLGKPISWVFTHLTDWLSGMTGTSAIVLGAVLGLMIAFDMGGPVNKTAFLFGTGLIATGNQTVMGMCAAAIPVMPLGQGLATLIRRRLYSEQERETGMASLFMGLFGISEGAIPFAAARPAQVIPANMLGGAVAGAVAGMAGVTDAVPHGGPIVAVLGAVGGVPMFFVAVAIGSVVTALATVALVDISDRRKERAAGYGASRTADQSASQAASQATDQSANPGTGQAAGGDPTAAPGPAPEATSEPAPVPTPEPVLAGVGATAKATATAADTTAGATTGAATGATTDTAANAAAGTERNSTPVPAQNTEAADNTPADSGPTEDDTPTAPNTPATPEPGPEPDPKIHPGSLTPHPVRLRLTAGTKEAAIREMAELAARTGKVADVEELVRVALAREAQGTTGLGEEIAIPHAKTDAVTAPVVGFARSGEGIDWDSLDGTRARLVFMISVPEAAAGDEHLRILALLSRKLMDADFRARLQSAPDEAAVLRVLSEVG
ncbi:PTS fructose transporter subunit IIC [Streptomyces rimosus]|nr:fructose-specific PTS transporter subunit EIIC [Streptomyces rimosus]KEF17023.1 PTS fructose transporter subunit IIC [Streptomyces rimosus]